MSPNGIFFLQEMSPKSLLVIIIIIIIIIIICSGTCIHYINF